MKYPHYIALCQKGDRSAFKALYQDYAPYVYSICKRYGVKEQDCADYMQDIFAAVFTSIGKFRKEKGVLKGWMRAITVNTILAKKRIRVNLYVDDGYNHEEIRIMLNIKVETSRSQLMRARKWLQKNIDKHYGFVVNSSPKTKWS